MPIAITMPALSPTMEEGSLAKWHIKPGDTVKSGDVIAEIETDKATMEVEAVDEGVVLRLLVAEGTSGVKVNSVIAELQGEGASPAPAPAAAAPAPAPTPAAATPAPKPATAAPPVVAQAATAKGGRPRSSPLARRLAQIKGVDLAAIKGSGPAGRIVRRDVEAARPGAAPVAATTSAASPPPPGGLILPQTLDPRVYARDTYELKPLDGMRRTVARRLTESFMQVPHFPLTVDLEIDRLLASRKAINESAPDGVKVSVNDILIKASAMALKAVPDANASYTDEGIAYHKAAHVSVAVAIDGGLVTPVIKDADSKGLSTIAAEMKDLAARARARKLKPQEYMGGTFSISNLGMFGIKAFASIINPPEGMILSVGEGSQRAVVRNGQLAVATVMTVTLTCDHRVVDGAIGANWLQAFRRFVETPESMLL